VIALGAFPGPANAALAIAQVFVVKKKRGPRVGISDPKWVRYSSGNHAMAREGRVGPIRIGGDIKHDIEVMRMVYV
jgi:hypothetical protein